ncbi:MAG: DUF4124 domain-containing protein [Acidiferrobacterales bacterium]
MKSTLIVLLLVTCGLASTAGHATLYRWVDKDGNVSYQDQPPPADATQVQEKNLDTEAPPADDSASSDAASKQPVTLYVVPQCDSCDQARNYLKKRKIPFREVDVASDVKAQAEMRKSVGELSVPTITVGSRVMKGYTKSLLSVELDDAGYPKAAKPAGGESPEGATQQAPAQ